MRFSAEAIISAFPDIAARYTIGAVLLPAGADRTVKSLAAFPSVCAEKRIPVNEGGEGYRLNLGSGARLTVLALGGRGMILAIARWLILDGLDEELRRRMLSRSKIPAAQVVLFPRTVKQTGSLTDWLRAARPQAGLWPFSDDLG